MIGIEIGIGIFGEWWIDLRDSEAYGTEIENRKGMKASAVLF